MFNKPTSSCDMPHLILAPSPCKGITTVDLKASLLNKNLMRSYNFGSDHIYKWLRSMLVEIGWLLNSKSHFVYKLV